MASPKDKLQAGFQFGKSKHYKPRSKSLGAAALLQSGIEALRHRQKQRKADSDTEVDSGVLYCQETGLLVLSMCSKLMNVF